MQLPATTPAPAPEQDISDRLYRAALGVRAQQRYLRIFAAFDARGKTGPRWHWPACISALNWLVARNLGVLAWGWAGLATLGSLVVLGLARMVLGASDPQLGWLLLALVLAASVAWGLGADALYYRVCNRRILRAVADSPHLDDACRKLQAQAARAPGVRLTALNAGLVLLAAGALVLLQAAPRAVPRAAPAAQAAQATVGTVQPAARAASAATEPVASAASAPAEPAAVASAVCSDCSPVPAAAASAASASAAAATATRAKAAPTPAMQPATMALAAPQAPVSTPHARRGFAVQIGIFAQPANARKVLETLQAARIEAYVEAAPQAPEQQRVRAGPFGTLEQARRAAERIRALDLPGVVVRLRD